jgi:hypothetical protein
MPVQRDVSNNGRKGWWVELNPDGEPLFCFHKRLDGKRRTFRFTLEQIKAEMCPYELNKTGEPLSPPAIHV